MFFLIKPNTQIALTLKKLTSYLRSKPLALKYNSNQSQYEILWKQQNTSQQLVATLTPFYKIAHDGVVLDFLSLEFFSKNIPFVDYEKVFTELGNFLNSALGAFHIYDFLTDRDYAFASIEENFEVILNESRLEGLNTIGHFLEEDFSAERFLALSESIDKMPTGFRIFGYAIYLNRLIEKQTIQKQLANTFFEKIITIVSDTKHDSLKIYFAFKFILYYKFAAQSQIELVTKDFLVKNILPFYETLSFANEMTQYLFVDFITTLYTQSFDEVTEIGMQNVETFIKKQKNFLFEPEFRTFTKLVMTGSQPEAFKEYVRNHKNKALKKLRAKYNMAYDNKSFLGSYYNDIILKVYYKNLPLLQQFLYEGFLFEKRLGYQKWITLLWVSLLILSVTAKLIRLFIP